ncbi:MAG: DUF2232 domain-containing protein [Desulfurivibrio sp.]|nr:DUF2232 domain-containing protein [Desulfurivibrio sp.]
MPPQPASPAWSPARIKALLLLAGPLLLPLLGPQLVWLHTLVPVSVSYQLVTWGRAANSLVLQALLAAAVVALFTQTVALFFFGLAMVPLGYILAAGIERRDSASWLGLKAFAYLGVFWLLLAAYAGISGGPTPLALVRDNLDQGMTAALGQQPGDGPAEQQVAATLAELRNFIDRAWPALFTISLLGLVWLNLLANHWLLRPKGLSPWSELRHWRLPDHFVALAAGALLLSLLKIEPATTIGLNTALVLAMLYFMQGLGVVSHLLIYWQVPPLLRGICYALVLLQGYGLLLLALLGLAEVRLNLRRRFAVGQ